MHKLFTTLIFVLALTACTTVEESDGQSVDGIDGVDQQAWAQFDHEGCRERGGQVWTEGLAGQPTCVVPYSDAGDICTDNSDCEGECRSNNEVTDFNAAPGEAKGICQPNSSPFGCYARINNGSIGPTLCVD